ncbi:DnaJ domain-containing protein [Aspergillus pseudoustus]|uniref:DnaJ domain-containing protein n=1 Tax=Aspergillus pseudoustus TaxID=1810923 RepID=A0ABR4KI53_9EURO
MAPRGDKTAEIPSEPPAATDLYDILGVEQDATQEQIKSAYKKLALKHHPDKAPADAREEANQQFQKIAFAYAILSDPRRRQRFDNTGSTAEAVDLDDDFDWVDFYREQFSAAIDTNALEKFKKEYQDSAEEKRDVLAAFKTYKGDLDRVYESVMFSNVLDDDNRFRAIIDEAIAEERVEAYEKYTEEPERKREQRVKRAQKEAKEAEKLAKELEKEKEGKASKAGARKGKKGSTSTIDNDDLAALIQQRQASRAESFFDRLEAKYNPSGKKRVAIDEPPEEAFEATATRRGSKKTKSKTKT